LLLPTALPPAALLPAASNSWIPRPRPLLLSFGLFLGILLLLGILFLLLRTLQRLLGAWSMRALRFLSPHVHPCLLLLHALHTYRPVSHLLIRLLLAFSFQRPCILGHHSLTQRTVAVLLLILLLCDF
jgi:hypothetical protein